MSLAALILAVAALALSFTTAPLGVPRDRTEIAQEKPVVSEDALTRALQTKRLKVGYAGYPPYLKKDLNTGEISGYSVEIAKAILDPIDVQIDWVETTWDTMKQDVLVGKFDLMIEPVFMTIPRGARVGFTDPYAYFGYGAMVVRKGDDRFESIDDLNYPQVNVVVTQGVASHEFAERRLQNASLRLIPGNDITITLSEVLHGKADVALADVPTALGFVRAHKDEVSLLLADSPPAITPAGFMTRQGETKLIAFLNSALLYLQANGTLDALDKEYSLPSFREEKSFVAGRGLEIE